MTPGQISGWKQELSLLPDQQSKTKAEPAATNRQNRAQYIVSFYADPKFRNETRI